MGRKKPRTREEWERVWHRLEPVFGDQRPDDVTLEDVEGFYAVVRDTVSLREAHRCIKIWRALWQVLAALKYCDADQDPSFALRNKTPPPRQATWREGEAARLVKGAWRMGFRGLAALMATAWDGMLAPVDARMLTAAQRRRTRHETAFTLGRAKTGRAAAVVLSHRAERILDTYLHGLGVELHGAAPLFRNRSGTPYTKDTLGDDFRTIREAVFPGDKRKLLDMRRSGAVEAVAGDIDPLALASAMANTIAQSSELQRTYIPVDATLVEAAAKARKIGRARLRGEQKADGISESAGPDSLKGSGPKR